MGSLAFAAKVWALYRISQGVMSISRGNAKSANVSVHAIGTHASATPRCGRMASNHQPSLAASWHRTKAPRREQAGSCLVKQPSPAIWFPRGQRSRHNDQCCDRSTDVHHRTRFVLSRHDEVEWMQQHLLHSGRIPPVSTQGLLHRCSEEHGRVGLGWRSSVFV